MDRNTPEAKRPEQGQGLVRSCFREAKRQQIISGARRVFLKDGFEGASIDDIVRAARVSKGTVYAYFPSKQSLFEALIAEDKRKQAEVVFSLDLSDGDAARVLRQMGKFLLESLLQPESLALLRIVIGAASRFPELGKAFFDAGPGFGRARLGAYFECLTAQGILEVAEPQLAASQFIDLCRTGTHLRLLLGDEMSPAEEEINRNIESAVRVFLSAYGPPRKGRHTHTRLLSGEAE